MTNTNKIFSGVTRWSIYLSFFLVPLFFLPWTNTVLETGKQMLLVILALLGLMSWLGNMVVSKKLLFRTGWINALPALFIVATLVASIFSLAGYQTWVGDAGQEYASFLTAAMLAMQFYVLLNGADEPKVQRGAFLATLLASSIAGIVGLLATFNLVFLPFDFARSVGFNTVGPTVLFGTYLVTVMTMGFAAWLVSSKAKDSVIPSGSPVGILMRALIVVTSLAAVVTAVVVDFWVLWILVIFGVLLIAVFAFLQPQTFPDQRKFAIPLFVLLVAVLLLFVRTPFTVNMPVSVSPSYSSSWGIAHSTLKEGWRQLAVGSGPGTFAFDYAKYRPMDVNGTAFWDTRLDRAKSDLLTRLATTGVAGSVAWLVLMLSVAFLSLSRLLRSDRDSEGWKMTYVLFAGFVTLLLGHLLYGSDMTLSFLLWGFAGLLAAQSSRGSMETDFAKSPRMGLGFSFLFVVATVGVLATLFVTGGRLAAEVAFTRAVRLDQARAPVERIVAQLGTAVRYNALSDIYYRNLSSALLAQARRTIASAAGKDLTQDQKTSVTNSVAMAVNAAKAATDSEPNNVDNWVARGSIYRDVMTFVANAEDFAAATFQQAAVLEPGNPSHQVNLGRVYLAVADRATQMKAAENAELAATAAKSETDNLALAEQALLKAIQLKPDYAPAHYYLAAAYERQGRLADAASRLAALRQVSPSDVGLGFQLSMLYIRLQKLDLAQAELERVVALSPDYSNALWYLGAIYEKNGDKEKAIAAIRHVNGLNPNNAAVAKRLDELVNGKSDASIPVPVEDGADGATDAAASEDGSAATDGNGVVQRDTGANP